MTLRLDTGRSNQKERTRAAIVAAARAAIASGDEVTMPEVARRALVSEATAYRYFPDLASLLREALATVWDSPEQAMEPVAGSGDPVERIGFADRGPAPRGAGPPGGGAGDDLGVRDQAARRPRCARAAASA